MRNEDQAEPSSSSRQFPPLLPPQPFSPTAAAPIAATTSTAAAAAAVTTAAATTAAATTATITQQFQHSAQFPSTSSAKPSAATAASHSGAQPSSLLPNSIANSRVRRLFSQNERKPSSNSTGHCSTQNTVTTVGRRLRQWKSQKSNNRLLAKFESENIATAARSRESSCDASQPSPSANSPTCAAGEFERGAHRLPRPTATTPNAGDGESAALGDEPPSRGSAGGFSFDILFDFFKFPLPKWREKSLSRRKARNRCDPAATKSASSANLLDSLGPPACQFPELEVEAHEDNTFTHSIRRNASKPPRETSKARVAASRQNHALVTLFTSLIFLCFLYFLFQNSAFTPSLAVLTRWRWLARPSSSDETIGDRSAEKELYARLLRESKLRFGIATQSEDVELWIVDVGELLGESGQRSRRDTVAKIPSSLDPEGLASRRNRDKNFQLADECGAHCRIRLSHPLLSPSRSGYGKPPAKSAAAQQITVEFRRWTATAAIPIVQFLGAENGSTAARPSTAAAECIYSASVLPPHESDRQHKRGGEAEEEDEDEEDGAARDSSIVNLCAENGGMFGTLTLTDIGTFAIEPLLRPTRIADADDVEISATNDLSRKQRRRRTLSKSLEANLRTAHLVYRLLPQKYEAPLAAAGAPRPPAAPLSTALASTADADATRLDENTPNHIHSDIINHPNSVDYHYHYQITASNHSTNSTAALQFATQSEKSDSANDLKSAFPSSPTIPASSVSNKFVNENNLHENINDNSNNIPSTFTKRPSVVFIYGNETAGSGQEYFGGRAERKERERRSANSWDNYVEVLVVADYKMLIYHQRNLENYVLTLFSTVASIYRHPSLGASINIIVVRLIILKHERAGPFVSNRAQETLQQFCNWQQNYNDANDDAISHHDVAILLTRHDICRATNKCDTLGLAELGTMCDAHKSCAIIEDNGLSAAFTIAHELGHILNIPHDDERKCGEFMPLNKNNYHIMAPTLEYNTNPWSWSPCSAHMLNKFLDSNRAQTQCILDQPIERRYFERMFENPAPGAVYTVNQQCQFVFGSGAEICPYMPTCRRLWCSVSYGYQMGCRTQHMPWADGTPCGDSMWCHRGHCVGMSPKQRQKQDGSWGEWKPWKECSRTCGGGVQKALRDCDRPRPANGGKYCVGQRERYRPCNVAECPWDTLGFREAQCAEFDGRDVGIHGVPADAKWLPKYTGVSENERCHLYCRQSNSAAFYLLRDKVADGTPCDQNTDDICIDGTCHKAGCDHSLGSDVRRDECGVCGGDGKSCRTVQGVYNERGAFGYNEVLRIPAGSANIDIRQSAYNNEKDDDNYLALRSATGEFLLNGHYQVSVFRQQISVLDTVLEYSGSDHATERINGTGPLRCDVFLHVLSVGNLNPPNVQYTFKLSNSKPHAPPPPPNELAIGGNSQRAHPNRAASVEVPPARSYYWRFAESWSDCSAKCQGTQSQNLVCVDSQRAQHTVEDRYCASVRQPSLQKRACNVECFNKYLAKTFARDGSHHRQIVCVRVFTNGGEEFAPEEECRAAGATRPNLPTTAAGAAENANKSGDRRWTYSEYSQCSETCGASGVMRRSARCVETATNRELDARHCDASQRETTESECNRTPCPRWNFGHWSECSRSCGGGIRVRHAVCQDASGKEISANFCAAAEKFDREKCNEKTCTRWEFGSWSPCSVTCGRGIQRRDARCVETPLAYDQTNAAAQLAMARSRRDAPPTVVDAARCDSRERIVEKECAPGACPHWRLGVWSACSATCGDGFQTRAVACVDGNETHVANQRCAKNNERPASHQTCNNGQCPQWRIRDWSECSVSCGSGVRRRQVDCIYREQAVDDSLCAGVTSGAQMSRDRAPTRQEQCVLLACARWEALAWGGCSASCGGGVQSRVVQCTRGHAKNSIVLNERECDTKSRPRSERSCERDACPTKYAADFRWETGAWSECSASCGGGIQRRVVQCVGNGRRNLSDDYCRHLAEPRAADSQPCQAAAPCAPPPPVKGQWRVGPWLACPQTDHCDASQPAVLQRRRISCEAIADDEFRARRRRNFARDTLHASEPAARVECNLAEKPAETRNCELPPACATKLAPKNEGARWHAGNWTDCSVSCGGGWRRRAVDCVDGAKVPKAALLCRDAPRPIEFEPCNADACDTARWRTAEWTTCSATCGVGTQRRRVWCQSEVVSSATELDAAVCERSRGDAAKRPEEVRDCVAPPCPTESAATTKKPAAANPSALDERRPNAANLVQRAANESSVYAWRPDAWSACSQSCGRGTRSRAVKCVDALASEVVADEKCEGVGERPATTHKCRTTQCPRWQKSKWSMCSATCGQGVSRREVFCQLGRRTRVSDSECSELAKPFETKNCELTACPTYQWRVSAWSKCSELCKPSEQYRRVYCMTDANKRAASEMCANSNSTEPISKRECPLTHCPYKWVAGPWSTCSRTCDIGYHFRKIECHVRSNFLEGAGIGGDINDKDQSENNSLKKIPSSAVVQSRLCMALEKPTVSEQCQMDPCDAAYRWSVGPWSECTASCGPGSRRRKLRCLDRSGERVARELCSDENRPKRRESCFIRNCLPIDCADLKEQKLANKSFSGKLNDGNYTVLVAGFRIKVYCHQMNETIPKTFLNVEEKTNFAEFYSKRLVYPYSCPYEGRRNDSCVCTNDGHVSYGKTHFAKIRVDLHNMKINPNDFTFASSDYGNLVPYGSAGDCYSMGDCPQGRFSIDLRNSGLKIVDDLQWIGQGYRVTTRIERSQDGTQIDGICGGYCGECAADRFKGLVFEANRNLGTP